MSDIPRGFTWIPIGDGKHSGCFRRDAINAVCQVGDKTSIQVGDQDYWSPLSCGKLLKMLADDEGEEKARAVNQ
jgi:hypothetical protein